jgi:hypothetical protein
LCVVLSLQRKKERKKKKKKTVLFSFTGKTRHSWYRRLRIRGSGVIGQKKRRAFPLLLYSLGGQQEKEG